MKNKTGQSGLTLVELMIAISILGLITAVGATTLLTHLPMMRLKSAARDVFSTMIQAKVEAIRRGENVTVSFNFPNNGYTMFLDRGTGVAANDNNEVFDIGETRLLIQPALPAGISIGPIDLNNDGDFVDANDVADADGVTFANNALVFSPRGIPIQAITGGLGAGRVGLRARDSSGNIDRQRVIIVSSAGRIRIDTN